MRGAIDLHVHSAPDIRPRKTTAIELARAAQASGMRALLLKNHETSTVPLAATVRELVSGIDVFGGLVLNEAVGGFNPRAVEAALRMGAAEIWMPTHCAACDRSYRGNPSPGLTIYENGGRIRPAILEILRLIGQADVILGTAHLGPREIADLIRAGREAGVRKFLITHPEIDFLNLSIQFQREISGIGVYFERCFARKGFALDWDGLAASIRCLGVETSVLATDLGQPENPDPVSGLSQMQRELHARGFSEHELDTMCGRNPAVLLGIE
jgi:hypothetical protein